MGVNCVASDAGYFLDLGLDDDYFLYALFLDSSDHIVFVLEEADVEVLEELSIGIAPSFTVAQLSKQETKISFLHASE